MRCLIFGTSYVDGPQALRLIGQWLELHGLLNPDCDLLLVDTPCADYVTDAPKGRADWIRFPDNIGHMGRRGRDGWGRAFCAGLQYAIDHGYDYAAHVEGDSLFRLPVKPLFEQMWTNSVHAASIPVAGTKKKEVGWVETGLMLMSVAHMKAIDLIGRYDWPAGGKLYPSNTPEKVVHDILGGDLTMMRWRGQRDQTRQLKPADVRRLDWVTQTTTEVFDAFFDQAKAGVDYGRDFFAQHESWRQDYRAIADALMDSMSPKPTAAIDLGCGNAYIIERLRERGVGVIGVDSSPEVCKYWPEAVIKDLTQVQVLGRHHDLVICTEVAEHLPPEAADTLIDNVCRCATDDATVFFSAAKAGRGGHLHLNEQEASYWIEKFAARGLRLQELESMQLRWEIANRTSATWWFAVNALVFRRG